MFNFDIEGMVTRALNTALYWVYAHTLGLLDPFYAYTIEVAAIVAACTAIGWFFPAVRSFFGAVAIGAITWLVGFRKGEDAARLFDKHHGKRK